MGKDKRRNKSRTKKPRSAERAINAARRLKIIPVIVKDLNRMANWCDALGVIQVAIIETAQALADQSKLDDFRFKDRVDELIKAHVAAQQAAQPQPITEPKQETPSAADEATATTQ